jgi:multiple sugar transport system ATP-binding protein
MPSKTIKEHLSLSDMAIALDAPLTAGNRFLARFGIRPEDIHSSEFVPPNIIAAPLTADVDFYELMGNEIFIYALTGGKQFIARVDPRTKVMHNQPIDMVVNMENMHLFDPTTEVALV